ncbi:hypothetical protein M7I_5614 [Glarea lozoyensis 74030]|uniref:Uncharacterized protein n=1 Tax=Glarea lozoyensis (strain ATCC 74030 / MF5533) TaxID=1104152 RepID=H0ESD5_GLAL7|nr:hypothetical protein M7I_5614 [Glarea lozoyensis 74030]
MEIARMDRWTTDEIEDKKNWEMAIQSGKSCQRALKALCLAGVVDGIAMRMVGMMRPIVTAIGNVEIFDGLTKRADLELLFVVQRCVAQ